MVDLRQGDCLEIMKTIPDKSVDMILCDLPYGTTRNKNDKRLDFVALWREYKRIIKDNGCIALFAQGLFYVDLVNSNRKWFRYEWVWDKVLTSGFLNAKRMPLRQHEQVAIFYKRPPAYIPQFAQGKPLHGKGTKYKNRAMTNRNYGKFNEVDDDRAGTTDKYPTSILRFAKPHPSKAKSQTQKSVELCEYLIRTYTHEGEIVLDNCMGSGSTGVACVRNGRQFIGIEIDADMFNTASTTIHSEEKINVSRQFT